MASPDEFRPEIDELRASRARVVAAADAARRRIERELHDGAQQHLVALAVKLELARQVAETDPGGAQTILDELREDVHEALENVRELAHVVYPPLLVDRGLADALAAAAARAVVPTRVEASGLDRYAPDVEATAYFCCLEALGDVGAHTTAQAAAAVRAWREGDSLHFEIGVDGGPGADECFSRTTVEALRDRLGAVDGRLEVTSRPGRGSRVLGTIPLPG